MPHEISSNDSGGLLSFDKFLQTSGLSAVTGWRFRKRGWLTTINIAGRYYIEHAEIARFTERARAGEFAKPIRTPRNKEARPAGLSAQQQPSSEGEEKPLL